MIPTKQWLGGLGVALILSTASPAAAMRDNADRLLLESGPAHWFAEEADVVADEWQADPDEAYRFDDGSTDADRLYDDVFLDSESDVMMARMDDDSRIVPDRLATKDLLIADVKVRNDAVSGVVVNRSNKVVSEVTVIVRQSWLWNNERNPGTDNPGRALSYTLAESIPPNGSRSFMLETPPLPERSDGRFVTTAEVVSFTQVGY